MESYVCPDSIGTRSFRLINFYGRLLSACVSFTDLSNQIQLENGTLKRGSC